MSKKTKRDLVLTIIMVVLCIVFVNMDKVLPEEMSNVLKAVVLITKSILVGLIFLIFYWTTMRSD